MSETSSSNILAPVSYETELYIYTYNENGDPEDFTSPSIIAFYMYRMPFIKLGSFGLLTVSLPFYVVLQIQQNLQLGNAGHYGKYPGAYLTFYIADTTQPTDDNYRTFPIDETSKLKLYLRILHITYRGANPSPFAPIVPVTMYVAPQQIHDLSLGNSYYRLFNDTTTSTVFEDYQKFLSDTYSDSDSSFVFKTYDNQLNTSTFDNILVKSANDIEVPNLLLKNYKLSNGVTYFFFDSMSFEAPNLGLLINLTDPNVFEIWNVFDDDKYEMNNTLRLIKKQPIGNQLNSLRPSLTNSAWVMRDPRNSVAHNKFETPRTITKFDKEVQNTPNERLMGRSSVYIDIKDPYLYDVASGYSAMLYAPDNYGAAIERYENLASFINNTDNMSSGFYRYEIFECHFDAIQFDKQYILDEEDVSSKYLPVGIVNIFSKKDAATTTLRHTVQFNTIKYKG